ncbi:uncharacterized protein LOC117651412 isoform X2 [Thrips palmi]|nr:uncharacterized protein LOC117651412 isoform X2 [Thrips palmi]
MTSLRSPSELWAFLLLLAFSYVRSKNINTFAGPYITNVLRAESCPSVNIQWSARLSHFNPQRPYDLQVLSGKFNISEDFGDNYALSVFLDKRSNNQWKENFFVYKFAKGGCSTFREHMPGLFNAVVKNSGLAVNKKTTCALPRGNFVVRNESVDWSFPSAPIMPYGRYRFRFVFQVANDTDRTHMCGLVECIAIPKP